MTSKEALDKLPQLIMAKNIFVLNELSDLFNIIYNDLDLLEIIKSHKLLNYVIKNQKCAEMYHLTQEEMDKLKELEK